MALAACRECGQKVSTEAPSCPHCGVPSPVMTERQRKEAAYQQILRERQAKRQRSSEQKETAYREALEQQKAKRAQRSGWGPIALAVVIVGGFIGYQLWSDDRPSTSSPTRQPRAAVQQMHPLDQMVIAFVGNHSRGQIKQRMDRAMTLYGLPVSEENYSGAGSVLVTMRKEYGVSEMDILSYMIRSYVPGVNTSFPEMATLSAHFLAAGDQ